MFTLEIPTDSYDSSEYFVVGGKGSKDIIKRFDNNFGEHEENYGWVQFNENVVPINWNYVIRTRAPWPTKFKDVILFIFEREEDMLLARLMI